MVIKMVPNVQNYFRLLCKHIHIRLLIFSLTNSIGVINANSDTEDHKILTKKERENTIVGYASFS